MKISAIITTYNRASIVSEAIRSVFEQSLPPHELLIVDDGSSDDTREVVASILSDAPFPTQYLFKPNGGMASSLNYGFVRAVGDWVAFLDDDDLWDSNHLSRVNYLSQIHPELGCIAGLRHEKGSLQKPPSNLLSAYLKSERDPDLLIYRMSPLEHPFFTPVVGTSVVHKQLLQKISFAPQAGARLDIHFFWRLSEVSDIGLDLKSHGIARQFRISLLSTDSNAPNEIKEQIALKKNSDDIAMLRDLLINRSPLKCQDFFVMLQKSLIGRSYLLRGFGRYSQALQHTLGCFSECPFSWVAKELLLATFRISPRVKENS